METNIDLKKIWNKQNIETPKVEILYAKANKLKIRSFLKLIVVNITLLLTITFIGFIWYYYQPELVTPNSKEYLQQLIKLKEKQTFQQTTMLSVYFIILSLGIGLYLFEYASRMTITWGIITYAITILWFAINWFYLRPKTITKQNAKLNKLLVEFEKLNKQMND
jgi:hypothetical protein